MRVRDAFFTEIYNRTKLGEDIVIVSSDIGAPSLDQFRIDFPERFINVGIAEQNSIAVAGGLQLSGKKAVTYGLNPFPVTRAFDFIRNILASLQIPVTVTALNAGSCSSEAGYTHMAVENMSLMRTLKNVRIVNPTDLTIIEELINNIINDPHPTYVQFDKAIEAERLYDSISFEKGFVCKNKGNDTVIVTYGIMAYEMIKADLPVIDCFSLPICEVEFIKELKQYKRVVAVEDSVLVGGIGSMVLMLLNKYGISKEVICKGLKLEDGYPSRYINRDILWDEEQLSPSTIINEIKELL